MMVIPVFLSFIPADKVGSPISESKWEEHFFDWLEKFGVDISSKDYAFFLSFNAWDCLLCLRHEGPNIMEMYHPKHPTWKAIELVDAN